MPGKRLNKIRPCTVHLKSGENFKGELTSIRSGYLRFRIRLSPSSGAVGFKEARRVHISKIKKMVFQR